jgi:hypothetical protein
MPWEGKTAQLLRGAIGNGDQIHVALVFGSHATGEVIANQRAGLLRNFNGRPGKR